LDSVEDDVVAERDVEERRRGRFRDRVEQWRHEAGPRRPDLSGLLVPERDHPGNQRCGAARASDVGDRLAGWRAGAALHAGIADADVAGALVGEGGYIWDHAVLGLAVVRRLP